MNEEKFNEYLEERISLIRETLLSKSKEYASSGNRYSNFQEASIISRESIVKKIDDFMLKHYVSYRDIIKKIDEKDEIFSPEYIKEKFGDIINYFILSEAYILEKFCKDE